MRLWHYKMIPHLPCKQLLSQWRELSAIVGAIKKNGTPNHILVNKIMDYDTSHLSAYTRLVIKEFGARRFKVSKSVEDKILSFCNPKMQCDYIYPGWHTNRYFRQCMANLQEKWDCGGMTDQEWFTLLRGYKEIIGKEFDISC